MTKDLGAPKMVFAPAIAYGHTDAFHIGIDSYPREKIEYRQYKFLGRIKPRETDDFNKMDVLDEARAKFGPRADVYRTARFWVVFEIQ